MCYCSFDGKSFQEEILGVTTQSTFDKQPGFSITTPPTKLAGGGSGSGDNVSVLKRLPLEASLNLFHQSCRALRLLHRGLVRDPLQGLPLPLPLHPPLHPLKM